MIKVTIILAVNDAGVLHYSAQPEHKNPRRQELELSRLLADAFRSAVQTYSAKQIGATYLEDAPQEVWEALKKRQNAVIREQQQPKKDEDEET